MVKESLTCCILSRMCLKQQRGAMPYEERLEPLNLLCLDARRNRLVVMFTMKCLFGLIHCPAVTSCTQINTRHLDTVTFKHHFARTHCLKNSATHTFPRIWSSLPPSLRNSVILVLVHVAIYPTILIMMIDASSFLFIVHFFSVIFIFSVWLMTYFWFFDYLCILLNEKCVIFMRFIIWGSLVHRLTI